ncbi:TetR/AcrR family transcriptional regulator [Tenuibacillus multivorans]|uniref:DNA-binding transcriptional regulator, AcrR family n=1 Tax=Tenuibacillus multivorans TaxID=237069 RepID=A0A1G9X551_9BACI|nr:TetR/AcrR family transcriptional regulator [Tenuibacillus multivorans]GEL77223.1 TetR family transcriptional regulator [Tenuibacillus multivorans]SDM91832.1 DNA-binding transcriptional regulator, AcrR family [Tenuibacillus multivorans]
MNKKEKLIIESSIELFAEKGFHATSVQEIVDKVNVAKGSFYNYFQSKEDLIVSIYDYYFVMIMEKMSEARGEAQNPREALTNQISILFQLLKDNKPLIMMFLRDQVPLGKDVETFMLRMRQQNFEWAKENVLEIYGEAIIPYQYDAAILLDGMLHSYSNCIVVDEEMLDLEYLPEFMMNRLDHVCHGLIQSQDQPSIKRLPQLFKEEALKFNKIRQLIYSFVNDNQAKALEALDVIEAEFQKDKPQRIILESMFEQLKKFDALHDEIDKLEKQWSEGK